MKDKITDERIKLLHPAIRAEVQAAVDYINQYILGKGVRLRLSCTWRTFEEQEAEYAKGRTKPGKIVTDAQGGESYHNYGLAFDIVLLYDKNGDGQFEEASWDMIRDGDGDGIADWMEVTRYLLSKGYQNGFIKNGKKWDFPHFQKTFGHSWRELKTKLFLNKTFTEVIGGKKYAYVKL